MDILAVDVGTTAIKVGVFAPDMSIKGQTSLRYHFNIYDRVKADIDPSIWWQTFEECCGKMGDLLSSVGVVSLSVTTPGLVPMAEDGTPLGPAILFMDGRSHKQSKEIRDKVGEKVFLRETCNLPVSGGSSLSSILWIRENQPGVWESAAKFGHCNTYMVKQLTGRWAIDPSTTSITGMYDTRRDDLAWNEQILSVAKIPIVKLPPLMRSHSKVGTILPDVASRLGVPRETVVLCGGNDAVLAALSGGVVNPGDIGNVHGTCDITYVCVDRPVASRRFNLRCHVLPGRWLTFHVLNTGGKALEWFQSVFCQDMTPDQFFMQYIPHVIASFLDHPQSDTLEDDLPTYVPYLQGSRYSLEQLTAGFSGLTLETSREMMLLALIKGNLSHQSMHLREVARLVELRRTVATSGGAAKIDAFLRAKKRWTGDFDYRLMDQSSLIGAAILGRFHETGEYDGWRTVPPGPSLRSP